MHILVIGSGGREHALCWRLKQSETTENLFCSPGNPGIAEVAECVALDSFTDIVAFCHAQVIGLVVIGPEQPLVDGLADLLEREGISVFGPSAAAAQLEGSKCFAKDLMHKYGIPTARYMRFDDPQAAISYIQAETAPLVIKADGLAAGKGVTVAQSDAEAIAAVEDCFSGKFGEAGSSIVIEERLEGEEASFFALCDGTTAIEFASAQDHKAVGEGDTGPNTGGMGAYSPAPIMDAAMRARVMKEIVFPTVSAMKQEGIPYKGVLFVGLMITRDGPKVIEFNCRFGDPETQVMLPRVEGDFAALLAGIARGGIVAQEVKLRDAHVLGVVMATKGYPGAYEKGSVIEGTEKLASLDGVTLFHAGTRRGRNCGRLKANGGRVLNVVAVAPTLKEAQRRAYEAVDRIEWPEGFCRRDIGWRAVGK